MKPQKSLSLARVTAVFRDRCLLQFDDAERAAEITGHFRFNTRAASDFPAVGDWVLAEIISADFSLIHEIQDRKTQLSRKAPGQKTEEQVLAANVDIAFVVTSFNEDFNLRRIERYLAIIRHSDIEPVVLINKSDLAEVDDPRLMKVAKIAGDTPIYRVSALTGEGMGQLSAYLSEGRTAIFLGSSGVGKSSILNALFGKEIQPTQSIRISDAKGRHTTTTRQMFKVPSGGFVIDTPGLREIQLWADEEVLPMVYDDVTTLIRSCRFADCQHTTEKECKVREALESGELEKGRWAGYIKLQKELAYLKRKRDPEEAAKNKKKWKKIHQQLKGHYKYMK